MEGGGHNSEAAIISRVNAAVDSLIKLEEDHEGVLQVLVDNQEDERETILLVLGRQLLEGRKGRSKENFGKWVNNNFPNLLETVNNVEVTAIIWAAEFPVFLHKGVANTHCSASTLRRWICRCSLLEPITNVSSEIFSTVVSVLGTDHALSFSIKIKGGRSFHIRYIQKPLDRQLNQSLPKLQTR
jgi:hypothetical protein